MEWKEVDGFPNYVVNREGQVQNIHTQQHRKASKTQEGAVKITLFKDGLPYTRSLALLVAKAHLYNDRDPAIFDTPIHLDNDPRNNHVDNLAWRPRWFAVKYQQQYWKTNYRHATTRIQDIQTDEVYEGFVGVCQRYGFLYMDVLNSCLRGTTVFPTWKEFRFLD